MFRCGALVIKSFNQLIPSITEAAKLIQNVLYVPLLSDGNLATVSDNITQLYLHVSKINPELDVRVILPRPETTPTDVTPLKPLSNTIEALLSPLKPQDIEGLPQLACIRNRSKTETKFELITLNNKWVESTNATPPTGPVLNTYTDIAMGGTFDRIHQGHRLLLTQAALVATRRVLVGVANGPLLTNKTLTELIKPINVRIDQITDILRDCKPELVLDIVPITDVMGPTAWDGGLTCLVASKETAGAIDTINKERTKKDLKPLELHVVDLISDDDTGGVASSTKISSSDLRKNDLAVYRTPEINRCLPHWDKTKGPYLIGLTGNTACGKSSIAKRIADKGAVAISCDQLGHKAYVPGTEAHATIVSEFGSDILNDKGEVDRKKLGSIVFADETKLSKLNDIVWPAIWRLAEQEIQSAHEKGVTVCVVDAAVLLKAEWDRRVHEVWVPVISPKESIKRVMERDGLTEERAKQRLSSQMGGVDIVRHAHMVLCTQWDTSYTQEQVDKAWTDLMSRIN